MEDIATKLRSAQPVVCSQYVWPGGAASSSPADNILCSNAAEAERSFSSLRTSAKNLPAQLNESAATQSPGCSACSQGGINIDVIACEFVAKSENRLATFGRI